MHQEYKSDCYPERILGRESTHKYGYKGEGYSEENHKDSNKAPFPTIFDKLFGLFQWILDFLFIDLDKFLASESITGFTITIKEVS